MAAGEKRKRPKEAKRSRVRVEYQSWWEDFRDYYFSIDRRTLGLTRILLGFFLLFDLWRRTGDWWKMFSTDGVLPNNHNLFRPQSSGWSLLNAFSTREELWVLWGCIFVVYLCLFVGYKTRVMQVLAAIIVASMNGRVLLIENGGYVVHNLLLLWTAFLPLGDRFSVDAMLTSMRERKEKTAAEFNDRTTAVAKWRLSPHVSLVCLIILLQLTAIYLFNVVHKTGRAWHDGTAVHYVLYVDRMANPLVAHTREFIPEPIIKFMTMSTMGLESALPVALLSPLARVWAKRIAIVAINILHLAFGTTFVLGPFAWALCVFSVTLFSAEDWELAIRTMKRKHRARTVLFNPGSRAALFFCRVLKRVNHFALLTFEADEGARGVTVKRVSADGATELRRQGTRALGDIIAALPVGPVVALPLRLPGAVLLFDALGRALGPFFGRFFGFGTKGDKPPVLSRDEAEAGTRRFGLRYAMKWLDKRYYATRRGGISSLYFGIALVVVGAFFWVYAAPLAQRKLDVKIHEVVYTWLGNDLNTLDLCEWGGLAAMAIGLPLVLRPLITLVAATPSPVSTKRRRLVAGARELLVLMFVCGAVNQALVELWITKSLKLPQPSPVREFSHKMRYLQGWFMFSPNPVMDDGTIVTDAITVDGRRVDRLSIDAIPGGRLLPPDFDLLNAKSFRYNQIWSDYYNRMHLPANTSHRKPMKEYIFRLHERTGNPNDQIVKGKVYWMHDLNPRFGRTKSTAYSRKELFSFRNPDRKAHERFEELTGGVEPPEIEVAGPTEPEKARSRSRKR